MGSMDRTLFGMDTEEAMEILGFNSLQDVTREKLRRNRRKLMFKHHPDRGGNPVLAKKINSAYKTLEFYVGKVRAGYGGKGKIHPYVHVKVCLISILDLETIYDGGEAVVEGEDSGNLRIRQGDFTREDISLILGMPIKITRGNGSVEEHDCYRARQDNDDYQVYLDLRELGDGNAQEVITVEVANKNVKFNMGNPKITVNMRFRHNIKLSINLERVESNG